VDLERLEEPAGRVGVDLGEERLVDGADIGEGDDGLADVLPAIVDCPPDVALGEAVDRLPPGERTAPPRG
jgi:hypothetical protein